MFSITRERIRRHGPALTGISVCIALLILWVQVTDTTEGWAVLLEMNDFPPGFTDLPVDFVDIDRVEHMLLRNGWNQSHIMIVQDTITQDTITESIHFLVSNADENDIIFYYIASHGDYIRHDLQWNTHFPTLWESLPSRKKILMVDSCFAAEFLPLCSGYMGIAAVSERESAWAGLPAEQLPVKGFVFTYFFCDSMTSHTSVEMAFAETVPKVRSYMNHVVYPAFKDTFPDHTYYNLYDPHPVLIDDAPDPLYLLVEKKSSFSQVIPLILLSVTGIMCLHIIISYRSPDRNP